MKKAKIGDIIKVGRITAVIAKLYYSDFYRGDWDVEFEDTDGNYRHWKSCFDGGTLTEA